LVDSTFEEKKMNSSNLLNQATYGDIQFKASHNAYERKEDLAQQLTFKPEIPSNCGCLSVELDIWRRSSDYKQYEFIDEGFFRVFHTSPHVIPPLGKSLKFYLSELQIFNRQNPEHHPILVVLDVKSTNGGYADFHHQIDTYLKCHFGESLLMKPKDVVQADYPYENSLCTYIKTEGWPSIEAMRGKFIFCLSGNKDWKSRYSKEQLLDNRYCFSDMDLPDNDPTLTPPSDGNIVFFNFHIFQSNKAIWKKIVPKFAEQNLITRAYEVNSESNWIACLEAKFNALATNKISNHSWAKVSDQSIYQIKQ